MGLYDRFVLPHVVHFCCSRRPIIRQRQKVAPLARGRVLEVGIGTGLNLPHYEADAVDEVIGLEPSREMRTRAARAARDVRVPVRLIDLEDGCIPLDRASIDTVMLTYTLCSISGDEVALREMARVIKPGGRLVFCEHGAAPDGDVRRWQQRMTPLWSRLGGGCRLDKPIPALIERAGYRLGRVETMYLPGWRPASFNYWGTAEPK